MSFTPSYPGVGAIVLAASSASSLRCLASCLDAECPPRLAMAGCTLGRSSCTGGSATCVMGESVSGRLGMT